MRGIEQVLKELDQQHRKLENNTVRFKDEKDHLLKSSQLNPIVALIHYLKGVRYN